MSAFHGLTWPNSGAADPKGSAVALKASVAVALTLSLALHALLLFLPYARPAASEGQAFVATLTARLAADAGPGRLTAAPGHGVLLEPLKTATIAPPTPIAPPIPGIVIPVFAAPDYYPASRLSPPPKLLEAPEPVFPDAASVDAGSVLLRLRINDQGGVDEAVVLHAQPPGMFEAAAVDAFSKAKFTPGRLIGVAVKSELVFQIQFNRVTQGDSAATRGY